MAYGVASGVRLLLSESESRYIRNAFSHYLSPAMVEQLVENPDALVLGGENRELTILFCDIRSFTSISETMEPTQLTVFLNNFLTPMTNVLMENGATIDKYIGDAIMAFWNAPIDIPEHRQRACESVLRMLDALQKLNETLEKPVRIGDRAEYRDLLRRQSRIEAALRLFGDRRQRQCRIADRGTDKAIRIEQSDRRKHGAAKSRAWQCWRSTG